MAKRTYTVPVLLILITIMAILIVLLYSRQLLDEQSRKTEQGERLAESYGYCQTFAGLLREGSEAMLKADGAAGRLPAAQSFGKLELAGGECLDALAKSGTYSGQELAAATKAAQEPIGKIVAAAVSIGGHEGPLTEKETQTLTRLRDGGAKLEEKLNAYPLPTKEERLRLMASGDEWVQVAQQAVEELRKLAESLA